MIILVDMNFTPKNPDFIKKVRESFAAQKVMRMLNAELIKIEPGEVSISLPFREDLTQQNGFVHAGIISTLADSACGYSAYSLMPAGADVLSVEFKVNLLAPAIGESFLAEAKVIKPGQTLTVVRCEVFAITSGNRKHIAEMQATMMCIEEKK